MRQYRVSNCRYHPWGNKEKRGTSAKLRSKGRAPQNWDLAVWGRGTLVALMTSGVWRRVSRGTRSYFSEEGCCPATSRRLILGVCKKLETGTTATVELKCCLGIILTGVTSGKTKGLLLSPTFPSLSRCPLLTMSSR